MPVPLVAAVFLIGPAPASMDVRETARAILSKEHCQEELPQQEPDEGVKPASGALSRARGSRVVDARPTLPGPLSYLLFIVLLGVAMAFLLSWLPGRPSTEAVPLMSEVGERAPPPTPLPDPDQFAKRGLFPEAIHALLLRALAELGRRRGSISPALTGRELLRTTRLSEEARLSLTSLVAVSEAVVFGGYPARSEDYDRCVEAYKRLRTLWGQTG